MTYIKFTNGECPYLTKERPYQFERVGSVSVRITNDLGLPSFVYTGEEGSAHIGGNFWHYCDKNGNLTV